MELKNLKKILETRPDTKLEVVNYSDPSDGSISLSAYIIDTRFGTLIETVTWHYNLNKLLETIDEKLKDGWRE